MIGAMSSNPAEETAETTQSVVAGMGYPNGREETSPTPTGWQGSEAKEISEVSRETLRGEGGN